MKNAWMIRAGPLIRVGALRCAQSDSHAFRRLGSQGAKQSPGVQAGQAVGQAAPADRGPDRQARTRAGLDAPLPQTQHACVKAKLFQHRGCQAVRLPKAFHFEGTDVLIEKRGDAIILRPIQPRTPKFRTLNDIARYLAEKYPDAADFPDPPPRPKKHERPILEW